MNDETKIVVYIGNDNTNTQCELLKMVSVIPENLYQVRQLPTNETEMRLIRDNIRQMRTELSNIKIKNKWNAKNISNAPIITIEDKTYPWWYIEKHINDIWTTIETIKNKYIEQMLVKDKKQEKFDETAGILLTEDNQKWATEMSKNVKRLIKTPNKLYAEINTWSEDKRAGFMVGWNATNHDTIPDKLRKIAYELESQ